MRLSIFSILILAAFVFTSCEKLEMFDKGEKKDCINFEMVYPLTYTLPDGSTITGPDEPSVETSLKAWYTANPTAKAEPSLNFPVQIVLEDGTSQTLNTEADWKALYAECEKDEEDCDDKDKESKKKDKKEKGN